MFARITLRPGYTRLKDDDKYWIQYKTKSGSVYKEYECSFTDLFPFVIPEDQCITYFKIELDNKDVFFSGNFKNHIYQQVSIDYKRLFNILKFQLT